MTGSSKGKNDSHSLRHRLAKRLRQLREAREWSQADLSKASGLHRTHVSLIERGCCSLTLDNLERLADALGVPATDLLSTGGNPRRLLASTHPVGFSHNDAASHRPHRLTHSLSSSSAAPAR